MASNSKDRHSLEMQIKRNSSTDVQRMVVKYLELLRNGKYSSLINTVDPTLQQIAIGELKMLERLMSVLTLSAEPLDFSAVNSLND